MSSSWSGLPMPVRRASGAVRVDARRGARVWNPAWLLMLVLLLSVDIAVAMSCKRPDRWPTPEEHKQLDIYVDQLRASRAALSAALHADPLLGPELRRFARIGATLFDPRPGLPDIKPPIEESLKLAQEDELLALVLLWDREDLGTEQRAQLIERWRSRGLPWTVLAAWAVDLRDAAERDRYIAVLRESLALPINNPLALRVRTLGIRYFELEEQYPEPQLADALRAVYPGCNHGVSARGLIAASAFEITTLALRYSLLKQECGELAVELEEICTLWLARLRRESFLHWGEEEERAERLSERIDVCGPLTMLRAVQDHYGDWEAVEARLHDCVPVTAEATDRAPD
jgi:hypothetical protein